MLSTLLTVALSLTTLSSASSLPNIRRGSGILKVPVTALNLTDLQAVSRRQDVLPTANVQTGTLYVVSFSIGTPPQLVSVALDTGSSDTWVNPDCSTAGSASSIALCNSYTKYVPGSSSTSVNTGIPMDLAYGKGEAQGTYWKDTFHVGGATVTAQRFGVASASKDLRTGLMGVGPGVELTGYPTIIDELATQGVTQSRAFSLDLRSVDSPDGAIIFGGIDTKKFVGVLEKRPIIPANQAPDFFDRYWIYMTSVGITKPGAAPKLYAPSSNNPKGQAVFLDSGGTLSRLPTPLFKAIVADFPGAVLDSGGSGLYLVPCSVASQAGTVDFGFGNTIIHVPYHEFIWFAGPNTCVIGVAADDEAPVLGDSFLRAAYVVYDQDNKNLLLANAANCGTNLVAIGKGPDAVPSVAGGCGVSSTSSSTSSSSTATSSSSTSSSSASTTSSSSSISSSGTSSTSSSAASGSSSSSTSSSTGSGSSGSSTSSSVTSGSTASSTSSSGTSGSGASSTSSSSSATGGSSTSGSSASSTGSSGGSTASSTTGGSATLTKPPTTSYPVTTETASTDSFTLSTVYTTTTYTITSCAPIVTNCPYGHVTTETIALYTTYCPITPAAPTYTSIAASPSDIYTTSTVYATKTYTITSCAPTVTNCPYGSTTTSTYALYTTVCPVSNTGIAPGPSPANIDKAPSSVVVTYPVVTVAVVPTAAPAPPKPYTTIVSVSPANTTAKASGTGVSPAPFKGGATALAANFMAIVLAGITAAVML